MRPLTFRAIVSILTFTLGVTAAAVWSARYFYYSARPPAGAAQPEWKEVDIDGKVTFRVPTNVTTGLMDTTSPYGAFRREGIDISLSLENIHTGGTCVIHGEENLSKSKVKGTRVGGRDATVLNLEVAAFVSQPLSGGEVLKGVTVCVPDVGDGEHELDILAGYKDERDYQDVLRIIDSIEFH